MACYYKTIEYITNPLFNCKFLTNLNTSYFLLAIALFDISLGLPNPYLNLGPIQHKTLHHNIKRYNVFCKEGWTAIETWCIDSTNVGMKCQKKEDPSITAEEQEECDTNYVCVGSGINPPTDPGETRSASCHPAKRNIAGKAYEWHSNRGAWVETACTIIQIGGPALNTAPGELDVQVVHDASITYPPMPEIAELSYKGALYPIQSIAKQDMELQYGSFAFLNSFDPTQPLSFCVNTLPMITLTFYLAFTPYSSSSQGGSYRRGNVTYSNIEG
jgi:hypothetical protein